VENAGSYLRSLTSEASDAYSLRFGTPSFQVDGGFVREMMGCQHGIRIEIILGCAHAPNNRLIVLYEEEMGEDKIGMHF